MNASDEQAMSRFYSQNSAIHPFGLPSGGSLDSGYEEVDPFDKATHYNDANGMGGFVQSCAMNRNDETGMDFGNFGFPPMVVQQQGTHFPTYTTGPELVTSFQPVLDPIHAYRPFPSPSLGDASEDGHTGSMCSESPHQGPLTLDPGPAHQSRSFWAERPATLKRQATDSSVEVRYKTEGEPGPKTAPSRGRPRKRIPHTAVERRYRENLNAHLEKLRAAVPNLTAAQRRKSTDGADPMKPSKCEVLMGAVEYIKRLEAENDRLKRKMA